MPRLSNRPPQMRRYQGSYARVSINGKYHSLGKWGSDQAKAKYNKLIAKWRQDSDAASTPACDRVLIAELAADYVEHIEEYFGQGHNRKTSIVSAVRRFGVHFGDMWTDEFRPRHLEQARQIWIDRKCARSYINSTVKDIVRCFKWGVSKDKVPADVWKALESLQPLDIGRYGVREAPEVEPVEPAVVDATLPALSETVADMVRVQLMTGCRPNEIMRLTPGEVDRTDDVWKYQPARHKNAWRAKKHTVYFGPQCQEILSKYMLRGEGQPCFTNKHGEQFARGGYRQPIRRAVKQINRQRKKEAKENGTDFVELSHWTPNQLRHLKATELRAMQNIEAACAILGHGSRVVTQIYAQLNEQPAIELARQSG